MTEGYINLTVHDLRFSESMAKVEGVLGRVGKSMESVTNKARIMFLSSVSASVVAVRTYGTFERAMRRATAVSEATEAQFSKMSMMAEEQSKRLNIAAVSAADAFYYLGSAGLTVKEQMQAYVPVLALAKAATIGAAEAAENMVDTIKGFRMPFSEAGHVADVMTQAVISSNMNFTQLGQTLELVAGVAHIMNNTIEDTVAVIAHMANVGIKASMAGTSLRRALLNLGAPTTTMRKMLDMLGLEVYTADGRMKSFLAVLGEMNEILKDATEEQRNMAFRVIFGARAISGQVAVFQTGKKVLDAYADSLRNAAGATERVAGKQLVAFLEQMGRVWRQMKILTRHIGEMFAPAFLRMGAFLDKGLIEITKYIDKYSIDIREIGERMAVYFEYITRIIINFTKHLIPNWRNAWKTINTIVREQARTMWDILKGTASLIGRTFIRVFKSIGSSMVSIFRYYGKLSWRVWADSFRTIIGSVLIGLVTMWERAIAAIWNSAPMKKLRDMLTALSKLPGISIPKRVIEGLYGDVGLKVEMELAQLRGKIWEAVAGVFPEGTRGFEILEQMGSEIGNTWLRTGKDIATDAASTWDYIKNVHKYTMTGHLRMWKRFLDTMPEEWKRTHTRLLGDMQLELARIEGKYLAMRNRKAEDFQKAMMARLPSYGGGAGIGGKGEVGAAIGFVGIEDAWRELAISLGKNALLNEQQKTTGELKAANRLHKNRDDLLVSLPDMLAAKLHTLGTAGP